MTHLKYSHHEPIYHIFKLQFIGSSYVCFNTERRIAVSVKRIDTLTQFPVTKASKYENATFLKQHKQHYYKANRTQQRAKQTELSILV